VKEVKEQDESYWDKSYHVTWNIAWLLKEGLESERSERTG
jgi:hypothetical protein